MISPENNGITQGVNAKKGSIYFYIEKHLELFCVHLSI